MCLGFKTAEPVRYERRDPYEDFYNGNIYDPIEEKDKKPAVQDGSAIEKPSENNIEYKPLNQSSTGLQIHQGGN